MIIDKVLPDSYAKEIRDAFMSDYFPWYFNDCLIQEANTIKDQFQFTHTLFLDNEAKSDIFSLVKPMIYFIELHTGIKIKNTIRIKANLITRNNSVLDVYRTVHQDVKRTSENSNETFKSFLYYIEDSDGDTIMFEDDKITESSRITPKANKGVYFDSMIWHTSTFPKIAQRRMVINFIFEVEDE
jgi:hypothetical protein